MWLEAGPTPALLGLPEGSVQLRVADDERVNGNPLPVLGRFAKRIVDIVLATIGLLLALPLLIVVAVAVRQDSWGPAFFKQVRVGANGRPFILYKFRSMVQDNDDSRHRSYVAQYIAGSAERNGGMFKLVQDPRITRLGRWLRRTSLDEVPQLWNVLRGQMSLVGPRPALPSEVDLYSDAAWQRLRVKPGLTGLWQVSGRSNLSFDEMITLDIHYWKRWSLLLDVVILLKTPMTVLTGGSA